MVTSWGLLSCHCAPESPSNGCHFWLCHNLRASLRTFYGMLRWNQGLYLWSTVDVDLLGAWKWYDNTLMVLSLVALSVIVLQKHTAMDGIFDADLIWGWGPLSELWMVSWCGRNVLSLWSIADVDLLCSWRWYGNTLMSLSLVALTSLYAPEAPHNGFCL